MEENATKGICIALFFVDTLIFGCLPYLLLNKKGSQSSRIKSQTISYFNCFAGGVFLGACLLHLMVEGRETLDEYFVLVDADIHFPVFEAIAGCGFFLIAFVEQLAHVCLDRTQQSQTLDSQGGVHNVAQMQSTGIKLATFTKNSVGPQPPQDGLDQDSSAVSSRNGSTLPTQSVTLPTGGNRETHEHKDHDDLFSVMQVHPMRAFLLLAAFSFHTVFDGLAVGLQQDNASIWQMFAAICIHKSLVALCLGLQLFVIFREKPVRAFTILLFFSLIAPVGVGVGMTLSSVNIDEYAQTLSRGILEALSTGTFLYVAFFEILHQELGEKKGFLRLVLVVFGFAGTAVAKIFDQD